MANKETILTDAHKKKIGLANSIKMKKYWKKVAEPADYFWK